MVTKTINLNEDGSVYLSAFEHDRAPLVIAKTDYQNYSLDVSLEEIWENESCKKVLTESLRMLTEDMVLAVLPYHMTLRGFLYNAPFPVTGSQLKEIREKLETITVNQ